MRYADAPAGHTAVCLDDQNVEPRALLEELNVAQNVGIDSREAYDEEPIRYLDGEPRERDALPLSPEE
jgi:hypothetical protein